MQRRTKLGVGSLVAAGAIALAAVPMLGASVEPQDAVRPTAASLVLGHPLDHHAEVETYDRYLTAVEAYNHYLTAVAFLQAVNAELEQAKRQPARGGGGGGGGRGSCDRPEVYGDGSYSIPSNIVERESHGNYGACNESSGACGAYQALDSTWDGYAGYGSACDAPPAVQDQWAAEAYAQSGCDPWGGC